MPGFPGGQKRALNPLELELKMVVSSLVRTERQIQVLCKSSRCFLTAEPSLQPLMQILRVKKKICVYL